jgi:hypothetical protein
VTQVYELPGGITTVCACPYCGTPFVPHDRRQATCGEDACTSKRREETRKAYLASHPEALLRRREAVSRWRERNPERVLAMKRAQYQRKTARQKPKAPMMLAAPHYEPHLPGGLLEIGFDPSPHRALPQEHLRALHGLLSTLRGKDHSRERADVTLLAWACKTGWAAYLHDRDEARALAGQRVSGRLYAESVTLTLGPLLKLRAPVVEKRGRHRIVLDAVTPVVIRSNTASGTSIRLTPTAKSLRSSLIGLARGRLGITHLTEDHIPLVVTGQATETRGVEVGGHWGHARDGQGGYVQGWVGHVEIETNAVGRWLLECAARIGLGGRTALGFGRVAVKEAE